MTDSKDPRKVTFSQQLGVGPESTSCGTESPHKAQHSVGEVLGSSGSLAKITLRRAELDESLFQKPSGHPGRKLDVYSFFFNFNFIYLFIYGCVGSSFSVGGLSLIAASGGHSSSRCAGLSLSRPLLLWSTGSRRAGSVIVAHGPSCSAACGILPDQGSNPCPLHWQADSQPLRHQGSPRCLFLKKVKPGAIKPSSW